MRPIKKDALYGICIDIWMGVDKEKRENTQFSDIVMGDEGSLIAYGILPCAASITVHVSSTIFHHLLSKARNYQVFNVANRRYIQYRDDVVVSEGLPIATELKYGVMVSTLRSISERLKMKGDERWHAIPETAEATEERPLSPEEEAFNERLKKADWHYDYSDDIRVWRAGILQIAALKAEAEEKGGRFLELYRHHASK